MTTIGIGQMFADNGDDYEVIANTGGVYYDTYKCTSCICNQFRETKEQSWRLRLASHAKIEEPAGWFGESVSEFHCLKVTYIYRGATCYLNSLFQTLFLTPQLREAIYQLPICVSEWDYKDM